MRASGVRARRYPCALRDLFGLNFVFASLFGLFCPHMRAFSHTYGKTDRLCRSSDDRSCRSTLPLLPSTETLSRSAAPYVAASSLRCSILQHRARPYFRGSPRPPAFAADGRCPTATSTSRLKSKSITSSGLRQITVFRSRRPVCRRIRACGLPHSGQVISHFGNPAALRRAVR